MNDVAKGFSKALVFIIVVVCCLFFIERNSLENKGIGDVNIENILEDERKEYTETKESYIEDAKKLYEKYNFKFVEDNFGKDFFDVYYGKVKTLDSDIPSEFMVYLAIVNSYKDNFMISCNAEYEASEKEVNSKVKELFDYDVKYDEDKELINTSELNISYDSEKKSYIITNNVCSGIEFDKDYIETSFDSAKMIENKLIIVENVYYVSYAYQDANGYTLNFHSGLTKDDPVVATNHNKKIDTSLFNKYVYTFEKEIGSSYKFISIEKK